MNPKTPRLPRLSWYALYASMAVVTASGQSANPAPDQSLESTDQPYVLSPFVVQERSEEGYYSPQAVSGSRTRTELINLPFNLTVFNENFLNDIAARDLVDVVSFASGVSGAPTAASDSANGDTLGFILRGQGGFVPNRNGFRRLRAVDPATISRVEILKGPSSVLYGQASPGGSVNYITKRPVQRAIRNASVSVGSYDFYRATVDVNVPTLNKTLAFRFVGAYEESDSWMKRVHQTQMSVYPSMTWWIKPETTLTVEWESTKRLQDNPQSGLPFHNFLDWDVPGAYGAVGPDWSMRAPTDFFDTKMEALTIELVHKINNNFTFRGNWSDADWEDNRQTNDAPSGVPSVAGLPISPLRLDGRQLNRSARGSFDRYRQVEVLNNFEVFKVKVQNLVGYQLGSEKYVQLLDMAPPARDTVRWMLNDPSTWILSTQQPVSIRPNTGLRARNQLNSGYFVNQLEAFDGRLHTLIGARLDKIKSDVLANPSGPTPTQSYTRYPSKVSPQYGVVYKLFPALSVYANYSTSIVNLYTTNARRPDGTYFNPVPGSGKGYDFGFKTDLMKGRLSGVLSFFDVQETDIVRQLAQETITNPDGSTETFVPSAQTGTNRSQGVEVDISARPTSSTQITLGYAYTYAYVEKDDSSQFSAIIDGQVVRLREGNQLSYSPRHQIAVNIRQDLGGFGPFNKIYLLANGRWVDERQHTDTWFVHNNRATAPWTLDAYGLVNAGGGAEFKLGKMTYNASLMVKNVLDETYLANRSYFGAPRTVQFTLRTSF